MPQQDRASRTGRRPRTRRPLPRRHPRDHPGRAARTGRHPRPRARGSPGHHRRRATRRPQGMWCSRCPPQWRCSPLHPSVSEARHEAAVRCRAGVTSAPRGRNARMFTRCLSGPVRPTAYTTICDTVPGHGSRRIAAAGRWRHDDGIVISPTMKADTPGAECTSRNRGAAGWCGGGTIVPSFTHDPDSLRKRPISLAASGPASHPRTVLPLAGMSALTQPTPAC